MADPSISINTVCTPILNHRITLQHGINIRAAHYNGFWRKRQRILADHNILKRERVVDWMAGKVKREKRVDDKITSIHEDNSV